MLSAPLEKKPTPSRNLQWEMHRKMMRADEDMETSIDLNPRHSLYYREQLPYLTQEWDLFVKTLTKPLPCTFRINARISSALKQDIRNRLNEFNRIITTRYIEVDGKVIQNDFIQSIHWLAGTYQLQIDNHGLSHHPNASLQELHHFLSKQAILGYISRQELASMIPVLLLDLQPDSVILDICSAPGSKTDQALSAALQLQLADQPDYQGLVVVNDNDIKRIERFVSRRFALSSHPSLLFTHLDGTQLARSALLSKRSGHLPGGRG